MTPKRVSFGSAYTTPIGACLAPLTKPVIRGRQEATVWLSFVETSNLGV
jgi:hypothetical protein